MDEVKLDTISWSAPEYIHKEKGNDWFWTVSIITVIACGFSVWTRNYIFAIFLFISGASLIMFTIRHPRDITYTIDSRGIKMNKELFEWKNIKSFNIKEKEENAKLLLETIKYFLPVYTVPFPKEKISIIKENLLKVIPKSEIEESKSMMFMEKIGF